MGRARSLLTGRVPSSSKANRRSIGMKYGEVVMDFLLLIGAVFLFYSALQIPGGISKEIGPALWPGVLLAGIAILSFVLLVEKCRGKNEERKREETEQKEKGRFYLAVILPFAYLYFLQYVGFILSTLILLGSLIYLMGYRRRLLILVVPVIFVASILIFFGIIMQVDFPRGSGFLREISYLFY